MSARLSDFDLENFDAQIAGATHFSARLCRLIHAADAENRALLRTVFPEHVQATELWERLGRNIWRCSQCGHLNPRPRTEALFPRECDGCHKPETALEASDRTQ